MGIFRRKSEITNLHRDSHLIKAINELIKDNYKNYINTTKTSNYTSHKVGFGYRVYFEVTNFKGLEWTNGYVYHDGNKIIKMSFTDEGFFKYFDLDKYSRPKVFKK